MSAPTLAIKLATSKSTRQKNGYYPIVLQITYQRIPRRIRLGMKAKPSQWNGNRFLSSANNGVLLNKKLDEIEKRAFDIYERHFENKKRFDYKEFVTIFKEKDKSSDFYDIANEFIEGKQKSNTRKFYRESVLSLNKLKPILDVSQLTPSVLLDHEQKYYSAAYMRGLRAIVNYAILKGYLKPENNPFKTSYNPTGYSFSHIKQKKKPVAFTESEIEKFKALEDESLYHDLAMFSYYTFGINMWDFLQFTDKNNVDGAIDFYRSKTNVHVVVPLVPQAKAIIEKYKKDDRWFPLCDFSDEEKAKKRCNNLRKKVNFRIKLNAEKLGIKKDVSLYTMRHTSATVALKRGAPIEKISALLGHLDISTTQTYLGQFESKELTSTVNLL